MRAKIFVRKISKGLLPFDYQYALASMLYGKLALGNIRLANESHSHQGFKFYNFSNLIIPDRRPSRKGLAFEDAHFILTSPDVEFVRSFAEGLLQEQDFHLYDQNFIVTKIEILEQKKLPSPSTFRTISPIFIKTLREENGELKEWELYPMDGKFHENIHKNLVERYTEYHGVPPKKDHFHITRVRSFKGKRILIGSGEKATPRRCSLMTFDLEASPELLNFAYDAGIGEKNAMGFGCVEVVGNGRNDNNE
ncbi:MAG: CRISPR-associated endoribonuclease Cas6 [Methanocellales archaeon]|nr:CRISPR-associated endoribonuclease Cas6 [Methanocellales archaeon]